MTLSRSALLVLLVAVPLCARADTTPSTPPGPTCDPATIVTPPAQTMSITALNQQIGKSDLQSMTCGSLNSDIAAKSGAKACASYTARALPAPNSITSCLNGLLSLPVTSAFANFNLSSLFSQMGNAVCSAMKQSINSAVQSAIPANLSSPQSLVQQGVSAAQQQVQGAVSTATQPSQTQPAANSPAARNSPFNLFH